MSRFRRAAAFVLLATTGCLLAPACVKNESSLYVKGCVVQALDTCLANADPTAAERSAGALDVAFAAEYSCPLLVGNQLVPRGDQSKIRTETSRIEIYAADVTILDGSGAIITRADGSSASFTVPTTGEIDPGTGTIPGFGLANILMLDAATAQDLGTKALATNLRQDVIASVIIRGRTLGGDDIETAPWNFPITVCVGCLCTEPPGIACDDPEQKPDPNCRIGQDVGVDCRYLQTECPF